MGGRDKRNDGGDESGEVDRLFTDEERGEGACGRSGESRAAGCG